MRFDENPFTCCAEKKKQKKKQQQQKTKTKQKKHKDLKFRTFIGRFQVALWQ